MSCPFTETTTLKSQIIYLIYRGSRIENHRVTIPPVLYLQGITAPISSNNPVAKNWIILNVFIKNVAYYAERLKMKTMSYNHGRVQSGKKNIKTNNLKYCTIVKVGVKM